MQEALVTKDAEIKDLHQALRRYRNARAPLDRVWYGKYQDDRVPLMYEPYGPKVGGCAIGYVVQSISDPDKRYIAKLGLPGDAHDVSQTMSTRRRNLQRSVLSVITEFVATDVYALLGQGAYYVPKHRLAHLPIITEYTKDSQLAIAVVEGMRKKAKSRQRVTHLIEVHGPISRPLHLARCKLYALDGTIYLLWIV